MGKPVDDRVKRTKQDTKSPISKGWISTSLDSTSPPLSPTAEESGDAENMSWRREW